MPTLTSSQRYRKRGRSASLDSNVSSNSNSDFATTGGNSLVSPESSVHEVNSRDPYVDKAISNKSPSKQKSAIVSSTAATAKHQAQKVPRSEVDIATYPVTNGNRMSPEIVLQEDERDSIQHIVSSIIGHWKSGSKLLNETIIRTILRHVRPLLMSEPMLVRVDAPVNVCGDLHGQITDLMEIFKAGGVPPNARYLFLGDYVDRGKYGTEVITTLLGLKVLFPSQVYILRGNHETDGICRVYGFFNEVKRRFSVKLFKEFTDVFNCLPISALVEGIALCMHGGISPDLQSLRQIERIPRPLVVADEGLACDILWSDPLEESCGWLPSDRGVSYTFGEGEVRKMCATLGIDIILRAHQVVDNGYAFFAGRQLVTIFSASNYCGEFTNSGAMMMMDENCKCSFQIFKPQYD
ncbi:unnamed protein product [Phytomonas sp. EM1]|nr:unnamed protein product [Phytomonas sp. EM1]|eukprot:CCW60544.1 unnamed protein product [Phytomonas sp. isolate EM1]